MNLVNKSKKFFKINLNIKISFFSKKTGNHFKVIQMRREEKNKKNLKLIESLKIKRIILEARPMGNFIVITFETKNKKDDFVKTYFKDHIYYLMWLTKNTNKIEMSKINFETLINV